jgi:hypothetical protein
MAGPAPLIRTLQIEINYTVLLADIGSPPVLPTTGSSSDHRSSCFGTCPISRGGPIGTATTRLSCLLLLRKVQSGPWTTIQPPTIPWGGFADVSPLRSCLSTL